MARFLDRLRTGLKGCQLAGRSVLLAVSGGADSVSLLRGVLALCDEAKLRVTAAHLNHTLRGEQSDRDAEWLATLCDRLGVRLIVERNDVRDCAASEGMGIEEAARRIRYRFLEESARRIACSPVVVAHTADDQAETILHHVIRGTGVAGLRGMPWTRPLADDLILARPMLEITRLQVEEYLAEVGQDFRCDATNFDEAHTRNRIRHSLLPLLRREYNPRVDQALRRLGRQAADVEAALDSVARELLSSAIVDSGPMICRLQCDELAASPRHLIRECLTLLWKELDWPRQQMGFEDWDRLADLVQGDGAVTCSGSIEARRRGSLLVLRRC